MNDPATPNDPASPETTPGTAPGTETDIDTTTTPAVTTPQQTHRPMSSPVLQITGLEKTYRMGDRFLQVLKGVDLNIYPEKWLAILGRSGSGKSTLLHLIGGLDRPDSGDILYQPPDTTNGSNADSNSSSNLQSKPGIFNPAFQHNIAKFYGRKLNRYRSTQVGFVFQAYHLLPELTALENVRIAGQISGKKTATKTRAAELLEQVGLKDRMSHRPARLSGGERQRVAIARALINEPAVLLADEPTGNLDLDTGKTIIELLAKLRDQGQTIVMVTHDESIAQIADQTTRLVQGHITTPGITTPITNTKTP